LNRYSYVMNNPLNATDPTGMFSVGGFSFIAQSVLGQVSAYGVQQNCASNPWCFQTLGENVTPQGAVKAAFDNAVMTVPDTTINRVGGGGMAVLGGVGLVGTGLAVGGTGCGAVVGCVAAGLAMWGSYDALATGSNMVSTGQSTLSQTNQIAQALGASPMQAQYVELATSAGTAGITIADMAMQMRAMANWRAPFKRQAAPFEVMEPEATSGNWHLPKTTATLSIGDKQWVDFNQGARWLGYEGTDFNTFVYSSLSKKQQLIGPNNTYLNSHAEIGALQQAVSAGATQGSNAIMTVTREVCSYCKTNLGAAFQSSGLRSLTVIDPTTTRVWEQGYSALRVLE
jgi:hypothetical protein